MGTEFYLTPSKKPGQRSRVEKSAGAGHHLRRRRTANVPRTHRSNVGGRARAGSGSQHAQHKTLALLQNEGAYIGVIFPASPDTPRASQSSQPGLTRATMDMTG